MNKIVLELKVKNHPGVMSHVCGLFARRAYNMEGILCLPMNDNIHSKIWLLVNEEERLNQVIKQTNKLEDVVEIEHHTKMDEHVFFKLGDLFEVS